MYVHFGLLCEGETQKKLQRLFRQRISEWTELGIVNRAVVTFHFSPTPKPSDSLYVCLDIPAAENLERIPSLIMQYLDKVCHEGNIKLSITDYKSEIEQAKKSEEQKGASYYNDAPVEEILRFASVGTSIAFEVLEQLEEGSKGTSWNDAELSRFILLRLTKEFGSGYEWMDWALHFVCNPLLIREYMIISPSQGCAAVETIKAVHRSTT